jgi:MinD superfamily P-loop ATPase
MSGYAYGQHEPTQDCPYCATVCRADFVDIGVGMQQCGPYHCESCGASEIGTNDTERTLTADEQRFGWYGPSSAPGSSANVIGGRVVSHVQMRGTYRREFVGNMLWHDKDYVDDWYAKTRRPA